jgi:hypothetical protein
MTNVNDVALPQVNILESTMAYREAGDREAPGCAFSARKSDLVVRVAECPSTRCAGGALRHTGFDRVRQPYLGLDMKNTRHEFAPRQQPIRVGIVGAGNWATYAHVPALQLLPNYRITAVATRHQESAKKYAHHHRIPYAFGNYEEMLQPP